MRASSSAFVFAVAAVCFVNSVDAQDAPERVKFTTASTPEIGMLRTETKKVTGTNKIKMSMDGQVLNQINQSNKESEEHRFEVLGVDGEDITKLRVTCVTKRETQDEGMGAREERSELEGKTFVIAKEGERVTVADAEGRPVTEDIAEAVREEYAEQLGPIDLRLAKFIPEAGAVVGETFTVPQAVAKDMFKDRGDEADKDEGEPDVESMSATLRSVAVVEGQRQATFDVALVLKGSPQPGLELEIKLTGSLVLLVESGWPVSMAFNGPVTFSGKMQQGPEMTIDIAGSGSMKIGGAIKYGRVGKAEKSLAPAPAKPEKKRRQPL